MRALILLLTFSFIVFSDSNLLPSLHKDCSTNPSAFSFLLINYTSAHYTEGLGKHNPSG